MDDKKLILPKSAAREIVRKSIRQIAGDVVAMGAHVKLRELGLRSEPDVAVFKKAITIELAKVAAKPVAARRFARYLVIQPNNTCGDLLLRVQKAYTLGLSGDVIPPDKDYPA